MKTNDDKFDEALGQLARSLRTVEGTEGRPIARRHARQRVLKDLRRIRALLDEKAPAIIDRTGTKRLTPKGRIARLARAGWEQCADSLCARYAAAGVPIRQLKSEGGHTLHYVPGWACAIGWNNPTKLRAAKKDPMLRKSVVAAKLLQESA